MPPGLPDGVQPYHRTPSFTAATIPAGLRGEHATKPGVWAVIHVESGGLAYEDVATGETARLHAGDTQVVRPAAPHRVSPIGDVRFHVVFCR